MLRIPAIVPRAGHAHATTSGENAEEAWIDVCGVDEIPNHRAKIVCLVGRERIAVFRYDGKIRPSPTSPINEALSGEEEKRRRLHRLSLARLGVSA